MAVTGTNGVNPAHDANLLVAEQQRQAAFAATASALFAEQGPQIIADLTVRQKAAEIAYYRAVKASCIANNCSPSAAIMTLQALGTGGQ
jgi:hypothetical protein